MDDLTEKEITIFVDESGTDESSDILYIAAVTTENPEDIRRKCQKLLDDINLDPEMSTQIRTIRENGLDGFHYASDDFEVKNKFIDLLPGLDFNAYIVFLRKNEIEEGVSKNLIQKEMLGILLKDRISDNGHCKVRIIYEKFDEGSKKVEKEFKDHLISITKSLEDQYSRGTVGIDIDFKDKSEPCLSIPDYMNGILSAYVKKGAQGVNDSFEERNFFRINGKIRLIHDLTNKKFYSRKNPFSLEPN